MPRYIVFSLAFLLSVLLLAQGAAESYAQSKHTKRQFEPFLTRSETTWSVSTGYRQNKFDFNAASDITGTATPNISFEEEFKNTQTLELKAKVKHVRPADIYFIKGGIQLEAEITGGLIINGTEQGSGYAGDNRTLETFRQTSKNNGGDTIGGAAAIGYKINLTGTPGAKARRIMSSATPRTTRGRARKRKALNEALHTSGPHISLTPLVGYAIDQQNYHVEDGFELFPNTGPRDFDFDLTANWYGPFIGLETELKTRKNMLRLRGELHDLTFSGTEKDNAPTSTVRRVDDDADGTGILLNAEYAYALAHDYALTIDATHRSRDTDPGTREILLKSGGIITNRLNEVNDESLSLHVGLRYNWN